jgi:hypothetical protein
MAGGTPRATTREEGVDWWQSGRVLPSGGPVTATPP